MTVPHSAQSSWIQWKHIWKYRWWWGRRRDLRWPCCASRWPQLQEETCIVVAPLPLSKQPNCFCCAVCVCVPHLVYYYYSFVKYLTKRNYTHTTWGGGGGVESQGHSGAEQRRNDRPHFWRREGGGLLTVSFTKSSLCPSAPAMASVLLHLRSEVKPNEKRTPLTPENCQKLLQTGAFQIHVEKSADRIFADKEYESKQHTYPHTSFIHV